MKKILCALLGILMMLSVFTLVSCEKEPETVKFGMGVLISASATDATDEKDGQGKATTNVAAITVDADGKVVACQLDTADFTVKYTVEGKAIANDSFKTKYEQGADYNMIAFGGATKEWFEQADAFESMVVGKTLDEIKALVAEGGKGNADVIAAGCTITVTEFVGAIEKAFANLADSNATAESAIKLGINAAQTTTDATEEKNGNNQIDVTVVAAAVNADGTVAAIASDCVQYKFGFTLAGASAFDATKTVKSKRELGADYGMVAYGGAAKEWFEQADIFNGLCIGKTPAQIVALCAADNYGTDEVKAAGCTVLVDGFAKAADKLD